MLLLSLLQPIEQRRREQFEARSKPIVDHDDAEMPDGVDPTLDDIELVRFRRSAKECWGHLTMPSEARPSSLKRSARGTTRFAGKRGARKRKKSVFSVSYANTTSRWSCRNFVFESV